MLAAAVQLGSDVETNQTPATAATTLTPTKNPMVPARWAGRGLSNGDAGSVNAPRRRRPCWSSALRSQSALVGRARRRCRTVRAAGRPDEENPLHSHLVMARHKEPNSNCPTPAGTTKLMVTVELGAIRTLSPLCPMS